MHSYHDLSGNFITISFIVSELCQFENLPKKSTRFEGKNSLPSILFLVQILEIKARASSEVHRNKSKQEAVGVEAIVEQVVEEAVEEAYAGNTEEVKTIEKQEPGPRNKAFSSGEIRI